MVVSTLCHWLMHGRVTYRTFQHVIPFVTALFDVALQGAGVEWLE